MNHTEIDVGLYKFDNGVTVDVTDNSVAVEHDWFTLRQHRNRYPCSGTVGYNELWFEFDSNGLVDMAGTDEYDGSVTWEDVRLTPEEVTALTAEYIGRVLDEDHPCWVVTVWQFFDKKGLEQLKLGLEV